MALGGGPRNCEHPSSDENDSSSNFHTMPTGGLLAPIGLKPITCKRSKQVLFSISKGKIIVPEHLSSDCQYVLQYCVLLDFFGCLDIGIHVNPI
ncbi:hypothetical protein TNCV_2567231 [Trichonephila clavipes]|uniref:Uncharacterized protein n=1 Tax=Trichonephila clavipes TaxID=2585209 RepID=A0A8X6WN61_TRICX|nr:hypothetical protein TNCV_2567231 [Trichonephila clavipes]